MAITLEDTGVLSRRGIAKAVGQPRSTVLDFLRAYSEFKGAADTGEGTTHLYIPDNQVKPDVDLSYLTWIGRYIVRKRPDVIINGGDFADMESLSAYDIGKRAAEGKRVYKDIEAAKDGMDALMTPLLELQQQQR